MIEVIACRDCLLRRTLVRAYAMQNNSDSSYYEASCKDFFYSPVMSYSAAWFVYNYIFFRGFIWAIFAIFNVVVITGRLYNMVSERCKHYYIFSGTYNAEIF